MPSDRAGKNYKTLSIKCRIYCDKLIRHWDGNEFAQNLEYLSLNKANRQKSQQPCSNSTVIFGRSSLGINGHGRLSTTDLLFSSKALSPLKLNLLYCYYSEVHIRQKLQHSSVYAIMPLSVPLARSDLDLGGKFAIQSEICELLIITPKFSTLDHYAASQNKTRAIMHSISHTWLRPNFSVGQDLSNLSPYMTKEYRAIPSLFFTVSNQQHPELRPQP